MSKQMFILKKDNVCELNKLLKAGWRILGIKKTSGKPDEKGELTLGKY